jgi:hypothetical protein
MDTDERLRAGVRTLAGAAPVSPPTEGEASARRRGTARRHRRRAVASGVSAAAVVLAGVALGAGVDRRADVTTVDVPTTTTVATVPAGPQKVRIDGKPVRLAAAPGDDGRVFYVRAGTALSRYDGPERTAHIPLSDEGTVRVIGPYVVVVEREKVLVRSRDLRPISEVDTSWRVSDFVVRDHRVYPVAPGQFLGQTLVSDLALAQGRAVRRTTVEGVVSAAGSGVVIGDELLLVGWSSGTDEAVAVVLDAESLEERRRVRLDVQHPVSAATFGGRLYVVEAHDHASQGQTVVVLDPATGRQVADLGLRLAREAVVVGDRLYVTDGGSLAVVDLPEHRVIARTDVCGEASSLAANREFAFVGCPTEDSVAIVPLR